jgi:hypothetical protein
MHVTQRCKDSEIGCICGLDEGDKKYMYNFGGETS